MATVFWTRPALCKNAALALPAAMLSKVVVDVAELIVELVVVTDMGDAADGEVVDVEEEVVAVQTGHIAEVLTQEKLGFE